MGNSVIIFTSDHGDGVGAHHWNQKSALYEEVVNVPLIIVCRIKACRGRVASIGEQWSGFLHLYVSGVVLIFPMDYAVCPMRLLQKVVTLVGHIRLI